MKRRLFTILSALSLLLCAATCALWVRSSTRLEQITLVRLATGAEVSHRRSVGVSSSFNGVAFTTQWYDSMLPTSGGRPMEWPPPHTSTWRWSVHSRDFGAGGNPSARFRVWVNKIPGLDSRGVRIPHWAAVAAFAVFPALWLLARLRRRKLVAPGTCVQCGYDLRATPDRCPECGATPKGATA